MNIVGVDPDALAKHRDKLKAELETVETMLELINRNGDPPIAPFVIPASDIAKAFRPPKDRRIVYYQGARRAILLALSTGPTGGKDICRAMGWSWGKFRAVARPALKDGVITESQGLYALTTEGVQMVAWFQAHPEYTVYNPRAPKC